MRGIPFLIILLLLPSLVSSSNVVTVEVVDGALITFDYNNRNEEILSNYTYSSRITITLDLNYSLSNFHNISKVLINRMSVAYIVSDGENGFIIPSKSFTNEHTKNTSDPMIFEYTKNLYEKLQFNPLDNSDTEIIISIVFTAVGQNGNYSYSASTTFSGPFWANYSNYDTSENITRFSFLGLALFIVWYLVYIERSNRKSKQKQ